MKRVVLPLLAIALSATDGYLYGRWTGRWPTTGAIQQAAGNLQDVPMKFGDWEGRTLAPLSAHEIRQAEYASYISRSYSHGRSGASFTILLACGRPGPVSVHTPDACYRGAGFQPLGAPTTQKLVLADQSPADFWVGRFGKSESPELSRLRVSWAWSDGHLWHAAASPRLEFAGASVLYKLYVIQEMSGDREKEDRAFSAFVSELLPVVNGVLKPKASS